MRCNPLESLDSGAETRSDARVPLMSDLKAKGFGADLAGIRYPE
jgi:hypothetical protein